MSSYYQCHFCRETPKSRADWLFHMILDRHSLKARENFRKWLAEMKLVGDAYVVGDVGEVDNSMLLEYFADNLRSFANIVFFKPQANICIIVCDRREINSFLLRPRLNDLFEGLNFRLYEDYSKDEWISLFGAKPREEASSSSQQNTYKRGTEEHEDNRYAKLGRYDDLNAQQQPSHSATSNDVPKTSSNPFTGYYSSDEDDDDYSWNRNRQTSSSASELPRQNAIRANHFDEYEERPQPSTENFDAEMETIYSTVMLPRDIRDARKRFLKYLRETFASVYPNCDFIPVGADFLGFNLESEYFAIYFDTQGITHHSTWADETRVISELQIDIDKVRTRAWTTLKKIELEGKLTDLKCEGADKVRFNHVIFRIKCRILFKPFKQAQTARLCKQLFYLNKHISYLLILVTYWAMQYSGFTARGSCNPFLINWLIYMFFMTRNSLPPVADLQKNCNFKILDGGNNVAFQYDESVFSSGSADTSILRKGKSFLMIEKLLEWFAFMDDTFGETKTKGVSRSHSLVCPRFGELIDKRKFKVCVEHFDPKPNLTSDQKKVRKLWKEDLTRVGFDESTWELLKDLKLSETFSLQHPLYISDNIGINFDGPFSIYFFDTIRKTRRKLADLVRNGSGSLIASL